MMAPVVREGMVYVTRTPSRRVIAVVNGRVIYSSGGDALRFCSLRCFRRWIRRYAARVTRPRRARTLALQGSA